MEQTRIRIYRKELPRGAEKEEWEAVISGRYPTWEELRIWLGIGGKGCGACGRSGESCGGCGGCAGRSAQRNGK